MSTAHHAALVIAGLFTLSSIVVSSYQMQQHIRYNNAPQMRKLCLRIIAMVPIYAINSFIGLYMPEQALYFDVLRECYESLVIYSFFHLLVISLGGEEQLAKRLRYKDNQAHMWPFCCLPTWKMAHVIMFTSAGSNVSTPMKDSNDDLEEQIRPPPQYAQQNLASNGSQPDTSSYGSTGRSPPASQSSNGLSILQQMRASSGRSDHDASENGTQQSTASKPAGDTTAVAISNSSDIDRDGHVKLQLHVTQQLIKPDGRAESVNVVRPNSVIVQSDFLLQTQLGTLQYCVFKPITAILAFLFQMLGFYADDSAFDFKTAWPYLAFINSCSQTWALYCLVLFYHALSNELAPLRPIPKFICVKAVVFATFWQGCLMVLLVDMGWLPDIQGFDTEVVSAGIQNLLVCIEMAIAAVAHHYAFSYKHFRKHATTLGLDIPSTPTPTNRPTLKSMMDAANFTDVYVNDVKKATARLQHKLTADTPTTLLAPLLDQAAVVDDASKQPHKPLHFKAARQKSQTERKPKGKAKDNVDPIALGDISTKATLTTIDTR